jgi:hypothetical protein
LTLLAHSSFADLTVSKVLQIATALDLFLSEKSDFFQNNFSLVKINAIYHSLMHAEPAEIANLLLLLCDVHLLTQENFDKIEKADFDPKKLASILYLLNEANILTQDNFDNLISLSKVDF